VTTEKSATSQVYIFQSLTYFREKTKLHLKTKKDTVRTSSTVLESRRRRKSLSPNQSQGLFYIPGHSSNIVDLRTVKRKSSCSSVVCNDGHCSAGPLDCESI
jgi:hypothetical protein